jgi:transcriptional regulator with XRE-family HTH domain
MQDSETKIPRLFELMKERQLTAKQVSEATGIGQSNFTEWKKGRCSPSQSALSTLAEYFGVPIEYIIGTDQDKNCIDISIQAELQQLTDDKKAEALKYIKYLKEG